ncbi:MAG: polysaccharide biosynthesis/export family protein [Candidatus Helarchaeota archaeon]
MSKHFILLYLMILFISPKIVTAQKLNPGDGVRIIFYNISDQISGDYFIQEDGYIQLPYIGLINTKDRDFEIIQKEIISKYNSLYRNPELTVQSLYKISILGEVRSPGRYYVTGIEKLSDIIALAGGETQDANLNKIFFIRGEKKINVNAKEIIENGRQVSDIGLKSGDQIYVPRKWWVNVRNASILVSIGAIIVTIINITIR